MHKRLIAAAVSLAALGGGAALLAPSAVAAANGSACQLSGNAVFGKGLTNNTQTTTYTFTGSLSNCLSGNAATGPSTTPSGGTIATLDPANITGSCSQSSSSGVSESKWNNGATTVVQYTTTGAAAVVSLTGKVVGSYTNSSGVTYTTSANSPIPVGQSVQGDLAFSPTDPQDCTGKGVGSAPINGGIQSGATS